MKRFAHFLVKHRLWFFIITLVVMAGSVVMMFFVNINEDLTAYLPASSSMRQGLDIIENEDYFPQTEVNCTFRLMFSDLTDDQKTDLYTELSGTEGISSVAWEAGSDRYNNDEEGYTLYVITTVTTDESEGQALMKDLVSKYKGEGYTLRSYFTVNGDDSMSLVSTLIPEAVAIVLVVLLILCHAFMEPVLMLVTLGVAVLINMGTNLIFLTISSMTFAIGAVMQLILSIDYSIMLMTRYNQERKTLEGRLSKEKAMENTVAKSMGSISSSAFTTIVGLLVLLLMSFTIGMDMGLVFAKGVLFSLVCVFTIMPTLIIWSDKALEKSSKAYIMQKIRERRARRRGTTPPSAGSGPDPAENDAAPASEEPESPAIISEDSSVAPVICANDAIKEATA
ncbi:MAG: MMPL family transporter [Clostridia bacterium]|nr:MMPL family transporter [Clostridia bacterium]